MLLIHRSRGDKSASPPKSDRHLKFTVPSDHYKSVSCRIVLDASGIQQGPDGIYVLLLATWHLRQQTRWPRPWTRPRPQTWRRRARPRRILSRLSQASTSDQLLIKTLF